MSAENKLSVGELAIKPGATGFGAGANYERLMAPEHAATAGVVFTEPTAVIEKYGPSKNFKRRPVAPRI